MKYTDDQLLDRVESAAQGFAGWKPGFYLIAVRAKADRPDEFDDKAYLFESKSAGQRPEFRMVATCTTNAGTYGLKEFHKYEPAGCAVLKADTIVYDSHVRGKHKTYIAYKQSKGFPYYRDSDKDDKAEQSGQEKSNVIAANIHRASPVKISTRNYNWSVGCIVLNNPNEFNAFMAMTGGKSVSLCILGEF